jgi:very-short-patch-repair endonuclease
LLSGPKPTQTRARDLRTTISLPEVKLWQALRGRPGGYKFRHQHPAGPDVLDFHCAGSRLAVEIDGEAHNRGDRPERDVQRDGWLAAQGVKVCRIPAGVVMVKLESVVTHIVGLASRRSPLHQPAAGPPPLAGEDQESI